MAACGLQHIFEKPLQDSSTMFDSLSPWKHIQNLNSPSSFIEIFGEFHHKETDSSSSTMSSPSSSSVLTESSQSMKIEIPNERSEQKSPVSNFFPTRQTRHYRQSNSFSSMTSDSLSLCTEGLGFESFDDVEDSKSDSSADWQHLETRKSSSTFRSHKRSESTSSILKRSRISGLEFPPPISCIGRTGKPWVSFKSYRTDGRFILKEVRIPTQEFLHASREDGRLKLHLIQSDDEMIEEEEDEEDEEEIENEDRCNENAEFHHKDDEEEKENADGTDEVDPKPI